MEEAASPGRLPGSGNDWPRHKAVITEEEHDLGVWLHSQRSKLNR